MNKGLRHGSFSQKNEFPTYKKDGLICYLDPSNFYSYQRFAGNQATVNDWQKFTDLSNMNNWGKVFSMSTSSNVNWKADNGGILEFDGVNDIIRWDKVDGDWTFGLENFAIEAWLYVKGYNGGFSFGSVWNKVESGFNYMRAGVINTNSMVWTFGISGGGTSIISPNNTFQLNRWFHAVWTRESINTNGFYMYCNGVRVSQFTCSQDFNNTTFRVAFGQYSHSNILPFFGNLGLFRAYKGVALTQADVLKNYNSERQRFHQ